MAYKYAGINNRPFNAVCHNSYGREVITTNQDVINSENIIEELGKALAIHRQNEIEIDYLQKYFSGDQPILYRTKVTRPEIDNKFVVNLAYELVMRKVAETCAEPIQYILRGVEESKGEEITELNRIMDSEDKQEDDIEICMWRSICGTAYRFVGNDNSKGALLDESVFSLSAEDPRYNFVCYYSNKKPAFSCSMSKDKNDNTQYLLFTNSEWFISDGKDILSRGLNGNGAIPLIEYPNNVWRLSDIEITIGITDAINVLQTNRIDGVEAFVNSWVKFVNCEVDRESFLNMRNEGALVVKSNNGENKADVDVMTSELNQSEGQVVFEDLFERFLSIQGLANRQGNTGGDTQGAVNLRNGHFDSQLRASINEPILKKSERQMLRIVLNRLRIEKNFSLLPSDIEIHINHNKLDNMLVKAEVLEILLRCGIEFKRAIKAVDLFSDPEQVSQESFERMNFIYPTEGTQNAESIENKVEEDIVVTKTE